MTVGDDVRGGGRVVFSPFSSRKKKVRVSFNASRSLSCFIITGAGGGREKKRQKEEAKKEEMKRLRFGSFPPRPPRRYFVYLAKLR